MVVVEVYRKNLTIKCKNYLISKASIYIFISTCLCLILPFVFAYRTGGFWLKRDVFYEQPTVKFKGEYLFYGLTNNLSQPVICSNIPLFDQYLGQYDHCPEIKVREIDYNFDAKIDELNVILDINSQNTLTLFNLIVPLEYKLNSVCPLLMESAIILQYFPPPFVSEFSIISNLEIFQAHPLYCKRRYDFLVLNDKILSNIKDFYEVEQIIEDYGKRNISTHLTNIYTNIKTTKKDVFTINLKVKYPEHKILYKPRLWQIIKWAWLQYLAIYMIICWILTKLEKYLFENKVLLYYEDNPFKNMKKLK